MAMPYISACRCAFLGVEQKRAATVRQHRAALTTMRGFRTMADKPLPAPEALRQLLRYDPETGKLFWRERTPEMFTAGTPGVRRARTPEHKCANWNAKMAGGPALDAPTSGGYRYGSVGGRPLKAHRVAWAVFYGNWPNGDIDHINGDRADNRIENLRDVSHTTNMRNAKKRSDNSSGHAGISWFAQTASWHVRIGGAGHVGYFKTIEEALAARDEARAAHGYGDRGR